MLVDPSTGLPIEEGAPPAANTTAGQAAINGMYGNGYNGGLLEVIAAMPGIGTTTAWNMRRVQNTIMEGGRGPTARGARGFRQTFSPLAANRLASVDNVNPLNGMDGKPLHYTPFNALANAGNSAPSFGARKSTRMAGTLMKAGFMDPATNGRISSGGKAEFFSRGTFGTMSSAFRVGGLDPTNARHAVKIRNAVNAASRMNPAAFNNPVLQSILQGGKMSAAEAQVRVMSGLRGSVSQRLGGYIGEATDAGFGRTLRGLNSNPLASSQGLGQLTRGAASAADDIARVGGRGFGRAVGATLGRGGGQGARMAGMRLAGAAGARVGLRAVPILGQVMMAYDITKMALAAGKAAVRTGIEAGHSFKGQIAKPIMGMGFKDNTVAATSRARGVMAIQNSRLNARSVLGSEAAGIHAHFG